MVLVDTSIWVGYLRGSTSPDVLHTVNSLLDDHQVAMNPVIRLELLRGASIQEAQRLEGVLGGLHELPFAHHHWQRADRLVIELRAVGLTPSLADLLIATSALEYNVPIYHRDAVFDAIARHSSLVIYRLTR